MKILAWTVNRPGEPMVLEERTESPGNEEVLVEVAGCGVCHTDLGYYYDGVPTRHAFPLTLGHEISGTVVETGDGAGDWLGKAVVIPAVIPCGSCDACRAGRGSVCPKQIFPGNDVHGGFATHLTVPSRGLCPVPDLDDPSINPTGVDLAALSLIADAVSTPYQALENAAVVEGDLVVFVGGGGVGGFGVQLAAARGAHVVAIDVDAERLELLRRHGADLVLDVSKATFKDVRNSVRAFAKDHAVPTWRFKILETSGTPQGQATAFGLVGHGGYLGVVGFTPEKLELRLSNLMAFDATARGTWGCLPEHYPAIVDLVLSGKVAVTPFSERRALSTINETFNDIHERRATRRIVLIPGS